MSTDPMVFTKEEAAEALKLSERKVQELIQSGQLPAVHFGAAVRIPKSALSIWLDDLALASLREQAVTDYLVGREGPTALEAIKGRSETNTLIGLGSRRKPRETKKRRRTGTSSALIGD